MFWALTLTAIVFGTVLEAMQGAWMPGRFFDLADVAADVAGAGLSLVAFQLIFGQKPGRIASD
jgi:VanZ family protein